MMTKIMTTKEVVDKACDLYLSKYDHYNDDLLEEVFNQLYKEIDPDFNDRIKIWYDTSRSLKNKL